MNGCPTKTAGVWTLVLMGVGVVVSCTPSAQGGEPIQFSTPNKEVDNPARNEPVVGVPRSKLKFELPAPQGDVTPPPIILIDPRMQKLLRERQEQNKNWLFNEPSLFKDRLPDPREAGKTAMDDAFRGLDSGVERVFGKPAKSTGKDAGLTPPGLLLFSDEPLFDKRTKRVDGLERSSVDAREEPESDSRGPFKNTPAAAMKALFESRSAAEKGPSLTGGSLSDLLGSAQADAKVLKRERETRREQFQQLLAPQEQPQAGSVIDGGGAVDQTRRLINPVAPVPVNNRQPLKNPLDPILPLSPIDLVPQRKLPIAEVMERYQTTAPARPPENKTSQMESLKLLNRPSILPVPGRSF
jgi:hypothetical protein